MHRDGYITAKQLETIDAVAKMIPVAAPEVFIYLEAEAELCQSRIQWRARDGEEAVELKYLRKLDAAYKDWLPSVRHFVIKVKASDSPTVVADTIVKTLKDADLLV
jgi:deoxyadenosine/deoxycytidine kinase